MQLSFNLSVDDWVAFQQYHQNKRAPYFKLVYPLIIGILIGLVVINIIYHFYFKEVSSVTWFSLVIFLILLYLLYIRKKTIDNIRQAGLKIQEKNPEAFGQMIMTFDDNGMTILSQQASKSLNYNEMDKFEENKQYFFLYSRKGVVYIIPKRGIDNPASVRSMLINNFSKE